MDDARSKDDKTTAMEDSDFRRMLVGLGRIAGIGGLAMIAYAIAVGSQWRILSIAAVALLAGIAGVMVGLFIGFLFGVPKSLQGRSSTGQQTDRVAPNPKEVAAAYEANTNLEQISDWLTKILVGVSLTQLTKIGEQELRARRWIGIGIRFGGCK
jgi:hypothetical protein